MWTTTLQGVLLPFLGTTLGAACVFFLKNKIGVIVQKGLTGFAAGVMLAASFWSLLLPALEQSEDLGRLAFVPAALGFATGIAFLYLLDVITPHTHMDNMTEGPKSGLKNTTKLILAVTIHNIPEGMAVGVVFAGWMTQKGAIPLTAAMVLAIGIAIQNFPEGAIVSMPLMAEGMEKKKTFFYGVLSGAVEPVAALLTILATAVVVPILPFLLCFAAGAMIYVVVDELVPEFQAGEHSNVGTISFAIGFLVMMVLDVALG